MRTDVEGAYLDRPVRLVIRDGEIVEGAHEPAAIRARAAVRAGAHVQIAGVWEGPASLEDPYALRATFLSFLDRPRFDGDPLPELGGVQGSGVVQ